MANRTKKPSGISNNHLAAGGLISSKGTQGLSTRPHVRPAQPNLATGVSPMWSISGPSLKHQAENGRKLEDVRPEICKVYDPTTALPWPGQLPCSVQRRMKREMGTCDSIHPDHSLWSTLASKAIKELSSINGTSDQASVPAKGHTPVTAPNTTKGSPLKIKIRPKPININTPPLTPHSIGPVTNHYTPPSTSSHLSAPSGTIPSVAFQPRHRATDPGALSFPNSGKAKAQSNDEGQRSDSSMESILGDLAKLVAKPSAELAALLHIPSPTAEKPPQSPPSVLGPSANLTPVAVPTSNGVEEEVPVAAAQTIATPPSLGYLPNTLAVISLQSDSEATSLAGASLLSGSSTNKGPSSPPKPTATSQRRNEPNASTLPPTCRTQTPPPVPATPHDPFSPFCILFSPSMDRAHFSKASSSATPILRDGSRTASLHTDTDAFKKVQAVVKEYANLYTELHRRKSELFTRKRGLEALSSQLEGRTQPKRASPEDMATSLQTLASKISTIQKRFDEKVVAMMDKDDYWLFVDPNVDLPTVATEVVKVESSKTDHQVKIQQEMDVLANSVVTLKGLLKQLHEGILAMRPANPDNNMLQLSFSTPEPKIPPDMPPLPSPSPVPSEAQETNSAAALTVEKMKKEITSLRDDIDNLRWTAENMFKTSPKQGDSEGELSGRDTTTSESGEDMMQIDKAMPASEPEESMMDIDTPDLATVSAGPMSLDTMPKTGILAERLAEAEVDVSNIAYAALECDVSISALQEQEQLSEFQVLKNLNVDLRARLDKLQKKAKEMDDFILFANDAIAARVMVMSQPLDPEKLKAQVLPQVQQELVRLIEKRFEAIKEGIKQSGSSVVNNLSAQVEPTTILLRELLETVKQEGFNEPNGLNGH